MEQDRKPGQHTMKEWERLIAEEREKRAAAEPKKKKPSEDTERRISRDDLYRK